MGLGESKQVIEEQRDALKKLMNEITILNENYQKQQLRFFEMVSPLQNERNNLQNVPPKEFAQTVKSITEKFLNSLKGLDLSIVPLKEKDQHAHICFAGPTSSGKSTTLNALFGKKVCETGIEETTMEIKPLGTHNDGYNVHDMPGNNDRISYLEFETICFFKSMSLVVIIYDNDPAAVMDLIKLCDSLKVSFVAVRNKIDDEATSIQEWKTKDGNKIKDFITDQNLFRGTYQVSSRNVFLNKTKATTKPMYDWEEFVDFLRRV